MQSTTSPAAAGQPANPPFKFKLTQPLQVAVSGERGECIARSEHATSEPQYLLRYKAADGRAVEAWWAESALLEVVAISGDDLVEKLTSWISKPLAQPGDVAQHIAYASGDAQPIKQVADDQRFVAAHPSRSAPRCKDCQHALKEACAVTLYYCDHPLAGVEPDTGVVTLTSGQARSSNGICGPAGRLFTLKATAAAV